MEFTCDNGSCDVTNKKNNNNGAHVCWCHASFIIFSVFFLKRQPMFQQKDERSLQRLLQKPECIQKHNGICCQSLQ